MVASENLLEELELRLTYPKPMTGLATGEAGEFVAMLRHTASACDRPVRGRLPFRGSKRRLPTPRSQSRSGASPLWRSAIPLALADRFPATALAFLETLTEP